LRLDYWESVKDIDVENLVFLDKTGVLLGLARTHARSQQGTRAYALTPFYRGAKVTVIGAISINKVVALMTMDNSMDSRAFELFVKDFLVPNLWPGAVVVMDNLSSHKSDSIIPMIESVGASVLFLSSYSPDSPSTAQVDRDCNYDKDASYHQIVRWTKNLTNTKGYQRGSSNSKNEN
jgi:transposase